MLQSLAKLLSKHVGLHGVRVQKTVEQLSAQNKVVSQDLSKMSATVQASCSEAASSTLRWGGDSKAHLVNVVDAHEKSMQRASQVRRRQ